MKRVIITGDDFGLAVPVNEAIAEAHRHGVLTAASLMVGAGAAKDAIERARRLPTLGVGLHIVLVEGRPVLPPSEVPALVNHRGEFSRHLVLTGFRLLFLPGVSGQLEQEIRAQFEAFRLTGLKLDHVNVHNHYHLHPRILRTILKVGRDYDMQAVRLPFEPPLRSWRATRQGLPGKLAGAAFLAPWLRIVKSRLRRAGIKTNDQVFGLFDSGRMTIERVLRFVGQLPAGATEIYFHPAIRRCPEIDRDMPAYCHEAEFQALIDPAVAKALAEAGAERIAFADLLDKDRRRNGIRQGAGKNITSGL